MRRLPQSHISFLSLRMTWIEAHYKRIVEEDIFGFFGSHTVALPILRGIRLIPVETGTGSKRVVLAHILYISYIYLSGNGSLLIAL